MNTVFISRNFQIKFLFQLIKINVLSFKVGNSIIFVSPTISTRDLNKHPEKNASK